MAKEYVIHKLDENAQPLSNFNRANRQKRGIDEMLGLCKGIIADNVVNESEVEFLNDWLKQNLEVATCFPGSILAERLRRIYEDGIVLEEERLDLLELLKQVTGQSDSRPSAEAGATQVLFADPEPAIVFLNHCFSFTGKFVSGTRNWCVQQVVSRGGLFHQQPIVGTDFLIIGTGGSRDWKHSAYGNKIEKAISCREEYNLKIISEEHWLKHLQSDSGVTTAVLKSG